jgi:hypothetical protein
MTGTDPAGSKIGAIPKNQLHAKRAGRRNCALHLRSRNICRPRVGARLRALGGRFHVSVSL